MNSRQMKRISALLAVALLSLMVTTSPSWAAFTDTQGNWAEPAILRLEAQGLMEGFPDGTFRPDSPLSRAQLAKIVVESSGHKETPQPTSKMTFPDVSPLHWAFPWVEYAESKGLVRGYPDGTYLPERAVSVLEMLTVLVRAKGWLQVTPSTPFFANIPPSHWGYALVMTALRHHFLLVPDPTFIDMP
ncbi:MAG: S-layer homology domain-containing protein, partial [Coprothermobacterota bacterium]|nr:S-layer homology domain-containing protein [Coprothermobacterota bacterium]